MARLSLLIAKVTHVTVNASQCKSTLSFVWSQMSAPVPSPLYHSRQNGRDKIRDDNNGSLLAGTWQSHFNGSLKAAMKKSLTAAAETGSKWSLTLVSAATGRPADWVVTEVRLQTAELKADRLEIVERTIRDTTVANLNTTNHSAEMVQRGLELYRAIGDSNGVCDNNYNHKVSSMRT